MKARATTLLSLVGVLVAGSAAALVNAQVLQPSTTPTTAAPAVVEASVTGSTTPLSVTSQPATQPATQAIYQIATAGAVTLDTSGDVLTVVDVVPFGDWVVVGVTGSAGNIDVVLQAGTTIVEFNASLVGGIVSTGVVVSQVVTEAPDADDQPTTTVVRRSGGTAATTSTTSVDDHVDDHDDEHESDDDD